jgi:hypothetical protein
MPSRSVQPAGKRHSDGGYIGGADAPDGPVACRGYSGQRQCASEWRCRLLRRSKRLIRWDFRLYALQGEAKVWGSKIRFGVSCGQSGGDVVLMGESAEDLPPVDPVLGKVDRFGVGRCLLEPG